MIVFALIERPFINISTGSNVQYVISMSVASNYAFYPKIADSFTRSVAQKSAMGTILMEKLLSTVGHVTKQDLLDVLQAGSTYAGNFATLFAKHNGLRFIRGR